MRQRVFALIGATVLVVSACGGSDSASCEGIAEDAMGLVQGLIDEIDGMSLEELSSLGDEFTSDFEAQFEDLEARADDANCSDSEMADLVEERVDDLTAETEFGDLFIEQFRAEGFGE
jgi:hypothetical protein